MKLFIVHPGIQHSPYLANASIRSGLFEKVTLLTSILFKPNHSIVGVFKKRIKPIDDEVVIVNHYLYTLIFEVSKFIHNKIVVNSQNQSHNNPIYYWQQIFGYLCLPLIWLNRKNCMVVCFETAGWPVTKYCKKWGIPVVMDFASISHEKAKELGIIETKCGIAVKTKERQHIDYAMYCSEFCKESFAGKTSAKNNVTLYLGAVQKNIINNESPTHEIFKNRTFIKISFIANLEFRKGLDYLLDALLKYQETKELEVYLIGRIRKEWVDTHMNGRNLPDHVKLHYQSALPQQELFSYLAKQNFDLNIQPSRFDSFAMVVPETMMLGIPNILSPYVGAGEMIDHLKNGYRMQTLDAASILKAIQLYTSLNVNEVTTLREEVLKKATHMTWDSYYQQTVKVFQKILAPKKTVKIAFIVEFPTQFEVPFYQYIDRWIKDQGFDFAQPDKNGFQPTGNQNTQSVKENWDFHVIYNYTDQQDYHDFELGKKVGWGFDLYKGYTYFIANVNDIQSSVAQIIDQEGYDFVILNGYKNTYKGLAELCKRKNIPIALRIDSVLYNLSPFKKLLKRIYLPYAYRHFKRYFAVGSETRKFLNWMGIPDEKINYFSYATDDQWFAEKATDLSKVQELRSKLGLGKEKVILSVAKFIERESPWDILHTFKAINNPELVLVLVGDGTERKALEQFASENPALKIIFPGYVPYTDLAYYYGLTEVFIHAAKNEPWGVSVQEALASGCTVITSDKVGSSTDLIRQEINGFIYQYSDIPQLEKVINQALTLDPLLKEKTNQSILGQWGYAAIWEQIKAGTLISLKNLKGKNLNNLS